MRHPKTDPRSELTLSAAPELDRWCACHPDGHLEPVENARVVLRVGAPLDFDAFQLLAYAVLGLLGSVIGVQLGRWIVG